MPLAFTGRAHFEVQKEFQQPLQDQDVSTSLTLPSTVSLGGAWRPLPSVRLSADLTYTTWSSLDAIRIHFADTPTLDQDLRRGWHNTLTTRFGADVLITHSLSVRTGVAYDPSPSPTGTLSPSLPDSDRLLFAAGAGWRQEGA